MATPATNFFPYKTHSPVETVKTAMNTVGNFLKAAIGTAIATAVPNHLILRQEVPIERWIFNYGQTDFKETKQEVSARGYAFLNTLEGAVRIVAEAIRLFIANYISKDPKTAKRNQTILNAQIQSIKLTSWAIINPNAVKAHVLKACHDGKPIIGCPEAEREWGTPYFGQLTIPVRLDYNWKTTQAT